MTQIRKMSAIIQISEEMLNPRERPGHIEPPTREEMAAFHAWKAKFEPLYEEGYQNGWFRDGGPDYRFEYEEPDGTWVFDD